GQPHRQKGPGSPRKFTRTMPAPVTGEACQGPGLDVAGLCDRFGNRSHVVKLESSLTNRRNFTNASPHSVVMGSAARFPQGPRAMGKRYLLFVLPVCAV